MSAVPDPHPPEPPPRKKGGHIPATPGSIKNAESGFGFGNHRAWIHVKKVAGRWQRVHRWSGVALIGFLFIVPWLRIGGLPAARVDLPGRRLYLLGTVFTAADGFNLVLLGLLAAFSLFFWTALLGRVWCGYLCPQTVFLEEWIRPIEAWIEGDRAKRMRRDNGPWTFDRIWRKIAKFSAFAVLALFLGVTFMSWFAGAPAIWTGDAGPMDYVLSGVIAFGFFWDWAWFREQLCNYVCPYARFQGALTDDHSLVISYLEDRGEPREKGKAAAKDGRCIDCNQCVVVCPQGIDIRDGFQMECVSCARCIDACTNVMGRLGHPSLVQYTTIAAEEGKKTRWIRPRTAIYATLLTALTIVLFVNIGTRDPFEVNVNHMPGGLYQIEDGMVRNTYFVDVGNNDPLASHHYDITVEGIEAAEVTVGTVDLAPNEWKTVPLVIRAPVDSVPRTSQVAVHVTDGSDEVVVHTTFKAPSGGGN